MALRNKYLVLYFTWGPVPTAAQLEDARQYGPGVAFRNAAVCQDGEGCEPCSAVAGEAPTAYKRKFPQAVPYSEWLEGKLPVKDEPVPQFVKPDPGKPEIVDRSIFKVAQRTPAALPPPPPPGAVPLAAITDARGGWELPPVPDDTEPPPPPAPGAALPPPPPPPGWQSNA